VQITVSYLYVLFCSKMVLVATFGVKIEGE
jgi:hypothetical protein